MGRHRRARAYTAAMKSLLMLASVLALVAPAYAQNSEVTVEKVGVTLLLRAKVQAELKMSKSQVDLVNGEFKRFRDKTKTMFYSGMTTAQQQAKMRELRTIQDGVAERILKTVTPTQKTRYRQLTLQAEGIWAVLIPEVTRALKVTPAQKKAIIERQKAFSDRAGALGDSRRKEINEIPGPQDPKDKAQVEAYRAKVKAVVARVQSVDKMTLASWAKAAMASAEAVLTPKQRAEWKKMLGPKFTPK
jgi:hypothetical protein